jgi:dihydroorotate dehydrogenase
MRSPPSLTWLKNIIWRALLRRTRPFDETGLTTQVVGATGKSVQEEAGGISGAPVRQRSTEVIRFIWQETQGRLPIIGVGGVFTPDDAWEKITAGASLVQVYTGWVYEGPGMVRRILEGLLQKLDKRGFTSLSQAIGQQD